MTDTSQQSQLPVQATITVNGQTGTFEAHDMHMLRALRDTTDIGDSLRSFDASGDVVIVLVKRGTQWHRVAEAVERLDREVTTSNLTERWIEEFR